MILWVLQSTLSTELGCGANFHRTPGHVGRTKWVLQSTLFAELGCDKVGADVHSVYKSGLRRPLPLEGVTRVLHYI